MDVINIGPALSTSKDWERERRRRISEILMRGGQSRTGHWSDGLADAGKSIAAALQLKAEDQKQAEREGANRQTLSDILKGGSAKPWTNPDTGQVSQAPAGGYDGMIAALRNNPNSELAAILAPQLMTAKMGRDQAVADRADQRAWQEAQAKGQRDWQESQTNAQRSWQEAQGQRNQDFQRQMAQFNVDNRKPVPGQDVPFPPAVQSQRVEMAAAGKPQWIQQQDPATGQTVQVNAQTGEMKAMPGDKAMTDAQANAALYADRMSAAEKILSDPAIMAEGMDRAEQWTQQIPVVGNYFTSSKYQQFDQAQRDFINAVLRRESGAVIAAPEFENARRQYLPQPGDKPEVLAQKAQNRRIAFEGIARGAGPKYAPQGVPPRVPGQPEVRAAGMTDDAAVERQRLVNKYGIVPGD